LIKKITWGIHIDSVATKALQTFIQHSSLLKSERLNATAKLTLYEALIRFTVTYACTALEFAADSHLLKLQRLQVSFSAPMVTYQGAHRPALYIWRSICRTFTIM
jgi:hypothetical protein